MNKAALTFVISLVLLASAAAGCGSSSHSIASAETVRTVTDYEGQVYTVTGEAGSEDFQEGQNAPLATAESPTQRASAIEARLREAAAGRRWLRTLASVRVFGDTAVLLFDPFASDDFADFNSLPADGVCLSILNAGFSGIDHVKIYRPRVGGDSLQESLLSECP
jgi:hypothetical protein